MTKTWSNALLDSQRLSSDNTADALIQLIMTAGLHAQLGILMQAEKNSDVLDASLHPDILRFANDLHVLPPWADQKKIEKAETFFKEYQIYVYSALLFASLPYCYAAADGARVLAMSNRMKDTTGKRLSETGQYIMDVSEPGAFSPEGKAFKSILKIRLIHAAVRYRLNKSGEWKSEWGLPINMEDMAGTNLAFSLVTLRAMETMGAPLDKSIRDAFIHKWNIISYLQGLDESLLPADYAEALLLEKRIQVRLFRPSEEGKNLTRSLTQFIEAIEKPVAREYGAHMIRHLLGNQVGDLLGLPEISLLNWPAMMSSLNGVIAGMGWSPKEKDMYIPLHLALIKRGKVQNERIEYPLQDLLKPGSKHE